MKRIKQELLNKGFLVHIRTEYEMYKLMKWLEDNTIYHWGSNGKPTGNICNWHRYKNETVVKIGSKGYPQLNYDSLDYFYDSLDYFKEYCKSNEILNYNDIWVHAGGYVEIENVNFDFNFDDEYSCHWGNNKEEKEMTKIENRIGELEQSIENNKLKLEELKIANKHANVSLKIYGMKLLINEEIELLKGYEALDDMEIGNVIVNDETVIVISLDGAKAISKLSDGDEFNFLAGFFLCLTKLGSAIDTDWYDYAIHVALEDIGLGNL